MNLFTLLTILTVVVCVVLLLRYLFWGLLTWWIVNTSFSLRALMRGLFWFIVFCIVLVMYFSKG